MYTIDTIYEEAAAIRNAETAEIAYEECESLILNVGCELDGSTLEDALDWHTNDAPCEYAAQAIRYAIDRIEWLNS